MNFRKTSSSWLGYTNLWLLIAASLPWIKRNPASVSTTLANKRFRACTSGPSCGSCKQRGCEACGVGDMVNLRTSNLVHKQDPSWWIKNARCLRLKKAFEMQQLLNDKTKPKKKPQKIHLEPTKNHCVFLLKKHHLPTNRHHFLGFNMAFFPVQLIRLASPSIERQAKARTCQMTWRKMRSAWKHLRGGSKKNTWFLRKMQTKKYFDSYCLFWFLRKKNKKRYL